MVDQSLRFLEGMVKDIMVRIQEYYIPANIYIGSGHIHFNLPTGKVRCQFRTLVNREQIRKEHNRRRRQARRQATQPQ